MYNSQSSSQAPNPFCKWLIFGFILSLTLHLLRSSSFITSGILQIIFCAIQTSIVSYYTLHLIRERPNWTEKFSNIPRGWKIILSTGIALLAASHTLPAQAAFYSAAETFVSSSFPQASTAVPLIFNGLRFVFLLYSGIALISVLNSARQGDDWLTVARSPAVVVIVVALGDVLTTIIVA